jgi:hypothetical protein
MTGLSRVVEHRAFQYRRTFRASVFTSFLSPLLFLTAMGIGLGGYVDASSDAALAGVTYLQFLAPGLLVATAMHMFRFFEVFLGLLRVVRLLQARRHEAQAYVHPRQAHTKSKLKPRTTKHESSILIFDEARIRTFY